VGTPAVATDPVGLMADIFPIQLEWEDGYLLRLAAWAGIELNREAARKHPFEMREMPHLRRLDAALTNW